MNWCDLSNVATAADHYSEWIPIVSADGVYLTQENRKHTEEVIKELHDAIDKVPIDDIPEMLLGMDVHKTTVIRLMRNSVIKIVDTFIDVIGSDCLCDIEDKFDPCVDDALEFFIKLLPVLEQQLQVLEQRFVEEPTDADKKSLKNLQKFIAGKFLSMGWDKFLQSVLLKNVFGIGVTRRLNYLLNNCCDESIKQRLAEYRQQYQLQQSSHAIVAGQKLSTEQSAMRALPPELDNDDAKMYFAKAVGKELMTDQYEWKSSQVLLACFAQEMCKKLGLGKAKNSDGTKRMVWKPFEELFNIKKGALRISLNDIQKTGADPKDIDKINEIFKE